MTKLHQSRYVRAEAITGLSSSSVAGIGVSFETLNLILEDLVARFASPDNFILHPVSWYTLADELLGIQLPDRDPPSMLELLNLAESVPTLSESLQTDHLALLVWLESTILLGVHRGSGTGYWVLLAYKVVLRLAQESTGLGRCVAYIQLANLCSQHKLKDRMVWRDLVQGLIDTHVGLSRDVLAQACLSRLVFTTDESLELSGSVTSEVHKAFESGRVLPVSTVQDVISAIFKDRERPDAICTDVPGTSIIIVRTVKEEVLFVNNGTRWKCISQGLTFRMKDTLMEICWSWSDGLVIPPDQDHELHNYLGEYHDFDTFKARHQERKKVARRLSEIAHEGRA
ncbi:hypothetical protein KCU77_g427, partial [Aureobasidium melanogenum]